MQLGIILVCFLDANFMMMMMATTIIIIIKETRISTPTTDPMIILIPVRRSGDSGENNYIP